MNSTDRHELRKQLLANGYRPLPLLDKGIRIKGWSTATIDEDWLEPFARSGKYQNTGIRCDDLIAFDIDVLDEDMADHIEWLVENICGESEFCRIGKWPKRLLLYRIDKPGALRSARTGKFAGHQVELLAGAGRQFAAFGTHPGTGNPYKWEGLNPYTTVFDKLPQVHWEEASAALIAIEDYFENVKGLKRDSAGSAIDRGGEMLYDLKDDTPFLLEGDRCDWGSIKLHLDEKGVWLDAMREDGEFGDSEGVHAFLAKGSGIPTIHDFPRDTTHQEALKAIQLPDPPANALFAPVTAPDTRDARDVLVDEWVLFYDQTCRMIDDPTSEYKLAGMKAATKHEWVTIQSAAGNPVRKLAADVWQGDRATKRAHASEMRPDYPDDVLFQSGKRVVFNTYRRPIHVDSGGSLATFFEFIEHLVPDEREREQFYDWAAVKLLHPSYRLHGLIMVTETQGTGRNTWIGILRKLLGSDYVGFMSFKDLIGYGSQGDFNEQLARALVIFADEAKDDIEHGKWRTRHHAFEGLKQVCDTTPGRMRIKEKYGKITIENVFASIVIATNHPDMLAIEPGDRRLIVLSNGRTKLIDAGSLNDRIRKWEADPANIGRLYRWFIQRAIDGVKYDPFGTPIDTPAKQIMIALTRNEIDTYYDMLVDAAPGDIITESQLMQLVSKHYLTAGLDLNDDIGMTKKAIKAIFYRQAQPLEKHTQIRFDKARVRPRVIRNFERWNVTDDLAEIKQEVSRNGNPGGSVVSIGSPNDSRS